MKLLFKIIFYIVVVFLVVLIGASIALRFVLKPEVLKNLISTQVQNYTGRTLSIGKLDYTLFPTFKLELDNVVLSNNSTFGNTPFLTIAQANLGVKIKPLLDKQIILTGIRVDDIELNLIQNSQGNNWQDLLGKPSNTRAYKSKSSHTSSNNSTLNIPFIHLQNLNINYQNGSKLTKLSGLSFVANNIRNDHSLFSFNAGSNISQSSPLLSVNWQLTGQASISPNYLDYQLKNVNIAGQVTNNEGQKKFALSNLSTSIKTSPGQVKIQPFAATLYNGQISGNAVIHLQTPSSYQLSMNIVNLDLKPLLSDLANMQNISGQSTLQAALTTKGQSSQQLLQNLSGNGSFAISKMTVEGIDLGVLYRNALAIIQQGKIQGALDFGDNSKIGNLTGNFAIVNGILNTQNTKFISPVIRADVTGNMSIPNQTLNFLANVTPVRGSMENLKDNGPTIPFNISGSFSKPKATPDLTSLLKSAVKEHMNNELDKVKTQLPKIGDSLKGIFGN